MLIPRIQKILGLEITSRELEILELIKEGYSYLEITKKLSISGSITRSHITYLFTKFKINTRYELTVYLWKHGIPPVKTLKKRSKPRKEILKR